MSPIIGYLSAAVSGVFDGSFTLPMKFAKNWAWENIWPVYSLVCLLLLPIPITLALTPDLISIYGDVHFAVVLRTFLFGLGWGIGSVFYGQGMYLAGLSLGSAVMTGLIGVIGSLVPMAVRNPEKIPTPGGMLILAAMLTTVIGVAFCGLAGKIRENDRPDVKQSEMGHGKIATALLVCVLASVFSSMQNFSYTFGSPIADAVQTRWIADHGGGADSLWMPFIKNNPIWVLCFLGGAIPNFGYCFYLMTKNKNWKNYLQPRSHVGWLCGLSMGIMWYLDMMCYGIGADKLGKFGPTVAWLIYTVLSVSFANGWGIFTGEWKGTSRSAKIRLAQGLAVLAVALLLLGYGNYLLSPPPISEPAVSP